MGECVFWPDVYKGLRDPHPKGHVDPSLSNSRILVSINIFQKQVLHQHLSVPHSGLDVVIFISVFLGNESIH